MKRLCPQIIIVVAHIHQDYTEASMVTASPYLCAIYWHNVVDGFPFLAIWDIVQKCVRVCMCGGAVTF